MLPILSKINNQLSKLGRAMLIPIVAQPVAGILSRFGQPDLIDSELLRMAADVIFGNMDLLFVVGASVAFTKSKDKTTTILGAILALMVFKKALAFVNPDLNMGIFAGIIVGSATAILYNYSRDWKTPSMFSFFTGEKFVVTLAPLAAVPFGLLFAQVWSPVESGLDAFAVALLGAGALGAFLFGFLNRSLIPFGLHHVINSYVFFEVGSYVTSTGTVVTGEIPRFISGDPTAGGILAMFYVPMLFGLPGAALAMYRTAKESQKEKAKALYGAGAATSIFAGVTEPLEFSFIFKAPPLYFMHAFFVGLAGLILYMLDVRLGFAVGFTAIDYVTNFNMGNNSWMIIPVGLAFFAIYYFSFKFMIEKYDYQIEGREPEIDYGAERTKEEEELKLSHSNYAYMAKKLLAFVGGRENIDEAGCCVTRLRLELHDTSIIDEEAIMRTGAKRVVRMGDKSIQIVIGTEVIEVMKEFDRALEA
ncbi:PTS transporter subunit EIIC [Vibrio artabrorum]|nr:PTS transporter subunit EIIC [Vibrio artabrorum]